jgi:hypothetical protein
VECQCGDACSHLKEPLGCCSFWAGVEKISYRGRQKFPQPMLLLQVQAKSAGSRKFASQYLICLITAFTDTEYSSKIQGPIDKGDDCVGRTCPTETEDPPCCWRRGGTGCGKLEYIARVAGISKILNCNRQAGKLKELISMQVHVRSTSILLASVAMLGQATKGKACPPTPPSCLTAAPS